MSDDHDTIRQTRQELTRSQLIGALVSLCIVLLLISIPNRTPLDNRESDSVMEPKAQQEGMISTGDLHHATEAMSPRSAQKAVFTGEASPTVASTAADMPATSHDQSHEADSRDEPLLREELSK